MTAPPGLFYKFAPKGNIGWQGMVHPERTLDQMGLYQVEPYRPGQIPVVLVHGLGSSPETWLAMVNQLRNDMVLRRKYQLLLFRYPSGFPILYNAGALRKRLQEFQQHYDPRRSNPNMRKMILVGHSMGGILSSAQIRSSGDSFTKQMFTRPIEELGGISAQQKEIFRDLLIYEANPDITRAVFIAAPHRGSTIAEGWLGGLGKKLIKFPFQIVAAGSLLNIQGVTDEGRQMLMHRPDSIKGLDPNAPGPATILAQPVRPGVTYHSIIGNAGMTVPLAESTDKVVPYWSSHLDGAVSELVIDSTHFITHQPAAIEEVRRILYLHAGLPYKARQTQAVPSGAH
jgi:hypothetical protein